jgi:hypothetical protein
LITNSGGVFVNVEKLNLKKYATRPALAKVIEGNRTDKTSFKQSLFDYLLYHEGNPLKAMELAALATVEAGFVCRLGFNASGFKIGGGKHNLENATTNWDYFARLKANS